MAWVLPLELLIILLAFYWLLYPIIISYCLYEFNKYRSTEFIRKRYPQITFISSAGVTFMITVNCPIILFYRSMATSNRMYHLLWDLSVFTQPISIYIALYGLIWRLWHCYFDIRLTQNVLNPQWASIIDPNRMSINDWYLNHKNTFGSSKFVGKRILVPCLTSIVLSICVWSLHDFIDVDYAAMIDAVLFLIPYSLVFILSLRTPSFGDLLHVRQEIKRVNLCILLNFITMLLLNAASAVFPVYENYISVFMSFSACSWLLVTILFQTKWVQLHVDVGKYLTKSISALENIDCNLSLFQIMNKQKSFEDFVDHLNREYSVECMLSYIECVQFMQCIMKNKVILNYDDTQLENKDVIQQNINEEFEDFVPKSYIIHEFNEINLLNIKKMAYKLFVKYIDEYSSFEINISYPLRSKFINLMRDEQKWKDYGVIEIDALQNVSNLSNVVQSNNLNENEVLNININILLLLFNAIVLEMDKLLNYSVSRFISNIKDELDLRTPS